MNMEKYIVAMFAAWLALGACADKVYEWPQLPPGTSAKDSKGRAKKADIIITNDKMTDKVFFINTTPFRASRHSFSIISFIISNKSYTLYRL